MIKHIALPFDVIEGAELCLGRSLIAFFSVSNEHQEQGAKARNSRLFQT